MATTRTFEENCATASAQLRRFADGPLLHLIDGEPTPSASGDTFDNHSPIDGALLGAVASGGSDDIDAAARAAADAFGDWSGRSGQERKRILHDVADLIVERADEIAAVECVDTGQTVRFMSAAAIRGAENFRFFADHAPDAPNGRSMPDEHHLNFSSRSPLGPGRGDHPVEHAVHAVDVEDRTGARGGLHGGAQARRMVTLHRGAAVRDRPRGGAAARRAEHGPRPGRIGRPGAHRTPVDQGDRVRR